MKVSANFETLYDIYNHMNERDELISTISDKYKELNGFRPRGNGLSTASIEELRALDARLQRDIEAELNQQQDDAKTQQAVTAKAMTPPKWSIGDTAAFQKISENVFKLK